MMMLSLDIEATSTGGRLGEQRKALSNETWIGIQWSQIGEWQRIQEQIRWKRQDEMKWVYEWKLEADSRSFAGDASQRQRS